MKKTILLPGLALVGGAVGFALRKWQLTSAFHPETGLFTHGAPATYALMGWTALMILLIFVLLRSRMELPQDFLPAFGCPEAGQMTVLAAAGLLLIAAGLLGLMEGAQLFQVWQNTPPLERDPTQLTLALARILTCLLCLPAGGAVLMMGKSAYRNEMPDWLGYLAPLPAFAALVWLFSSHLEYGTQPILMDYGFLLAAAACLMLAHYYVAGFLFHRLRPRSALFFALSGTVLGLTSLADGLSLGTSVLILAFVLAALGFSYGLLGNCFGPGWSQRMPSGGQDADETEDLAE